MPIDPNWLHDLLAMPDLDSRDTLAIDGVEIDLPLTSPRGKTKRMRDWQRRILEDIIPDSVNADAPERTPFRLLYALTTSQKTKASITEALSGDLAPLEELFRATTKRSTKKMTLAFHVLAVKAAEKKEADIKGFSERMLLLLCRHPDGSLDEALVRRLIEQFRRPPADLDLAQRTVLERIYPGWTPADEPTFTLPDDARARLVPFDAEAAQLFREDLAHLLDAALSPADFFQQLNLLLMLHLGLYQPRVASLLNPQMDLLYREMADPDPARFEQIEAMVARFSTHHPFTGRLDFRAPDTELRSVTLQTPCRISFDELSNTLATFHFNVLVLVRLRRIGEAYLASKWELQDAWHADTLDQETESALSQEIRGPLEILKRIAVDPEFDTFLRRATTALAVRFVRNQIASTAQQEAFDELSDAPSGLHALRRLYERYNIQNSRNAAGSRAYRQGIQITSSLLQQGQYGLVQGRQRVGPFFEIGAGILPLLILMSVGPGREKIPLVDFWRRLERYGIRLAPDERKRLLARLRSMGVYERYSDAGEAAYVRNLMTSGAAS